MKPSNSLQIFKKFYENFDLSDRTLFNQVYDEKIVFQDPFHKVEGQDPLFRYFQGMMSRVSDCSFSIKETIDGSEQRGSLKSAFVTWDMRYIHPSLNGGKELTLNGATHLTFDEKVLFHRDYFDSSQLLYRNIPILKSIIGYIERRL